MTIFYFSDVTNEFKVVSLYYAPSFSPFEQIFQVDGFHEIVPNYRIIKVQKMGWSHFCQKFMLILLIDQSDSLNFQN